MHTAPAPATRVIKKLNPGRPGARRWAAQYGDALVCVRYRVDAQRQERQTTVEIVVDRAPLLNAVRVGLQIAREELDLRRAVKAAGADWDPVARVWRLPLGEARRLGLTHRIAGQGEGR